MSLHPHPGYPDIRVTGRHYVKKEFPWSIDRPKHPKATPLLAFFTENPDSVSAVAQAILTVFCCPDANSLVLLSAADIRFPVKTRRDWGVGDTKTIVVT